MEVTDKKDYLISLIRKRNILEVLRDAFLRGITNRDILIEDYGLLSEEIEWFFKEYVKEEEVPISRLLPIVDKAVMSINNQIKGLLSELIRGLRLNIFNRWRELIEAKWTGAFRGRIIQEIEDSKVILLVAKEIRQRDIVGGDNYLLLGPGIYYCKFYLSHTREPIIFTKPIHGIALSSHIYEKAIKSPILSHGRFSDHYRKYLYSIFLEYNLYEPEDATQLRRLYFRIFYENISIIESFLSAIREINVTDKDKLEILSALPEFFNRIIVSQQRMEEILEEAKGGLPGIMGYEPSLDKLIEVFKIRDLNEILIILQDAKERFMKYGWDIVKELLPR